MDHHHFLTQSGVPRQPVLVLEGYMHVPELEGAQAGGTRAPLGDGKGSVSQCDQYAHFA